jgi:translation elongation factor EF-Ts
MIKNKNLITKILLILTSRNWFVSTETHIINIVSLILKDIFNKNIGELKDLLKKGGKTIKKRRMVAAAAIIKKKKTRYNPTPFTMFPKNYTKRRR